MQNNRAYAIQAHDAALTEAVAIRDFLDDAWNERTGDLEDFSPRDLADAIRAAQMLVVHLQNLAMQTARISK